MSAETFSIRHAGGRKLMSPLAQRCVCSVVLVSVVVLAFPAQAWAGEISVASENDPWWHDQWEPTGGDVNIGGYWSRTLADGHTYRYEYYAYAQGRMYCAGFDALHDEHGAGGYRKWGWQIVFEVEGEPGEQTDVFLELAWHGDAWVETTDVHGWVAPGDAKASSRYSFKATTQEGDTVGQDAWELYMDTHESHTYEEDSFGSYPPPSYLGRMTSGDTFSLNGDFEAYANAYVGEVAANLTTQARMDAHFTFEVTAVPVPEPATLGLLALGGLGLIRRRHMT